MVAIYIFLFILYNETFIFGYRVFPFFWSLEVLEFTFNINGSLFCILFAYAALIFWWRGALTVWILTIATTLPRLLSYKPDLASLVTNVFFLAIPMMILIFISLEINWRNKERKVLTDRENERHNYVDQIFKAEEEERKRLAREIHDDSIQRLSAIAINTQLLTKDQVMERFPNLKKKLVSILEMIVSVNQDLRRMSIDLRPTVLDDLGLVPALRWLVDGFKNDNKIDIRISFIGEERPLTKNTSVTIFRVVQEALSNIKKYACASVVAVVLRFTEHTIEVEVEDNGIGFVLPKNNSELTSQGKLGLVGMQQRVEFIKGSFEILSEPGHGTKIQVKVGI